MEQIKELGVKIADNTDEAFWIELKEKIETDIKAQIRNAKISKHMLKLCEEEIR